METQSNDLSQPVPPQMDNLGEQSVQRQKSNFVKFKIKFSKENISKIASAIWDGSNFVNLKGTKEELSSIDTKDANYEMFAPEQTARQFMQGEMVKLPIGMFISGGFLPMILPFIPSIIAGVAGLATATAGITATAKNIRDLKRGTGMEDVPTTNKDPFMMKQEHVSTSSESQNKGITQGSGMYLAGEKFSPLRGEGIFIPGKHDVIISSALHSRAGRRQAF